MLKCLRTRLVHLVYRDQKTPDPLDLIRATGLKAGAEKAVFDVLSRLPPPVALFWFVGAARPTKYTKPRLPFGNASFQGQFASLIRRTHPADPPLSKEDSTGKEPAGGKGKKKAGSGGKDEGPRKLVGHWPPTSICGSGVDASKYVLSRFCIPLAQELIFHDHEVDEEAVRALIEEVSTSKASIQEKDRKLSVIIVRRLQQFHTTLGMMWSLAYSASQLRDFELIVTSLELLLTGCLLIGPTIQIPKNLERRTMEFLLGGARPKEGFSLSVLTTPRPTPTKKPARQEKDDSSDEDAGEEKREEEDDDSSDGVQALNAVSPESLKSVDEGIIEAWELDTFLDP